MAVRTFPTAERRARAVRTLQFLVDSGGKMVFANLFRLIAPGDAMIQRSTRPVLNGYILFLQSIMRRGWVHCQEQRQDGTVIPPSDRVIEITPAGRIWLDHLTHESEFERLDRYALLCLIRAHQVALAPFGRAGAVLRESGTLAEVPEDAWRMAAELVDPRNPDSIVFPWSDPDKRRQAWTPGY